MTERYCATITGSTAENTSAATTPPIPARVAAAIVSAIPRCIPASWHLGTGATRRVLTNRGRRYPRNREGRRLFRLAEDRSGPSAAVAAFVVGARLRCAPSGRPDLRRGSHRPRSRPLDGRDLRRTGGCGGPPQGDGCKSPGVAHPGERPSGARKGSRLQGAGVDRRDVDGGVARPVGVDTDPRRRVPRGQLLRHADHRLRRSKSRLPAPLRRHRRAGRLR